MSRFDMCNDVFLERREGKRDMGHEELRAIAAQTAITTRIERVAAHLTSVNITTRFGHPPLPRPSAAEVAGWLRDLISLRRIVCNDNTYTYVCEGCSRDVDPTTCCCGSPFASHDLGSGHAPVAMGCVCGYDDKGDEEEL